MVPAMANSIGFTTFQGDQAHRRASVYISFKYVKNDPKALTDDYYPCNSNYEVGPLPDKFVLNEKCSCNSCESLCVYNAASHYISPFSGINWIHLVVIYVIVIVCTLAFFLTRKHYFNKRSEINSRLPRDSDLISEDSIISDDDMDDNNRKNSVNKNDSD